MSIPESGGAARTCRLDSASESAGSAALDGDGAIGAGTGGTTTRSLTIIGTTRRVGRFTTATITTEAEARAAEFVQERRDLPPVQRRAEFSTGPVQRPGPSRATLRLPEDTLSLAVKAEPTRALSAITIMVESLGAIRRAEASAWGTAAVAERPIVAGDSAVAVDIVAAAIAKEFALQSGI